MFRSFAVFAAYIDLLRNWKVGQAKTKILVGECKQIDRLLRPTVSKALSDEIIYGDTMHYIIKLKNFSILLMKD